MSWQTVVLILGLTYAFVALCWVLANATPRSGS